MARKIVTYAMSIALIGILSSCTSSSLEVAGNEGGSSPINPKEAVDYKKAILKCYKTGGSRVVKITGHLRCF